MISLCTVILPGMEDILDILIESVAKRTRWVKEILVTTIRSTAEKEYTVAGINVKMLGLDILNAQGVEHALGIHLGIDKATQEHIWVSDPDVFIYDNLDQFYLDMSTKHNLDLIGASHHSAVRMAYGFYPSIINFFTKKEKIPNKDFLGSYLQGNSQIFVPNHIPEFDNKFPNPTGHFDTGCNIVIWMNSMKGRWLSFQTLDCHLYTTQYYRSNFKFDEKLGKRKLLHHLVGASNNRQNEIEDFKEAYAKSFE